MSADTNFLQDWVKKILSQKQIFSRPEDIPTLVPDCGFNHGEPSVEDQKKLTPTLEDGKYDWK